MEKTYHFTVVLAGTGRSPEKAWEDAVEGFSDDPGVYSDSDYEIVDEDEEEE